MRLAQVIRSRRWRAYRTPAVVAPSPTGAQAPNLSLRTIRAYTDDGALLAAFLAAKDMPAAVLSILCEHVEAFIVAEVERTSSASAATRHHSLQQLLNWLDDEGEIQEVAQGQDALTKDP